MRTNRKFQKYKRLPQLSDLRSDWKIRNPWLIRRLYSPYTPLYVIMSFGFVSKSEHFEFKSKRRQQKRGRRRRQRSPGCSTEQKRNGNRIGDGSEGKKALADESDLCVIAYLLFFAFLEFCKTIRFSDFACFKVPKTEKWCEKRSGRAEGTKAKATRNNGHAIPGTRMKFAKCGAKGSGFAKNAEEPTNETQTGRGSGKQLWFEMYRKLGKELGQ